jgi:pimeloyl-ACP methyl ester carboxylesterase
MKLHPRALLPALSLLCLGVGPCGSLPKVVSDEASLPGFRQPQTPGSGLPEEFATPAAVTQLLGPHVDLNQVSYLRTHIVDPLRKPKAILVLVPGFLGSAATFAPMAEQLVLDMNGLVEVWSIDRRSNQLEDRLGGNYAAAAGAKGDLAGVAQGMQFYFPDTDKPPLVGIGGAAGPEDSDINRNGIIDGQFPLEDAFGVSRSFVKIGQDDMRYAAYWGIDTQARDWKILVDAARAIVGAEGVVVFGGHSAGTGFAGLWAAYDFDPSSGVDAAYKKIDGLLLLEGGGPGAPSPTRPTRSQYLAQVAALATAGGPDIFLQSFTGIDVPSLGAAAMVQGVAAYYDPRSPALAQRTPVFGGPPINILLQAPLSNEAAIGAFIDDDFSSFGAFRASVGFSDNGTNLPIPTTANVNGDYYYFLSPAAGGGLRQWKNFDDPTLPSCPPNTPVASPGCALLDNGPQDALQPLVWGREREVTDIKDLERVQYSNGNFAEWYFLSGRVSLDQQYGRDSSSLGDESLLAVTQNANMDRPVLAIGGSNGLAPLPSSWNSYFGSIATPAADKEIAIIEGYAHLDLLTAKHNETVPIVRNWIVKLLGRKP